MFERLEQLEPQQLLPLAAVHELLAAEPVVQLVAELAVESVAVPYYYNVT